jgi:hypothetical protein
VTEQSREEEITDIDFRLLSVASLLNKMRDGISIDELYGDAERKFDTLIEILGDTYDDSAILSKIGYSLNDLKQLSFSVFNHLISNNSSSPHMTICVLEDAPLEEIKRRRNKLLNIFHPDRPWDEHSDGSHASKINEAYEQIVNNQSERTVRFENIKTNIPDYYHSRKKMKYTVFVIFTTFLLIFIGLMKRYHFF